VSFLVSAGLLTGVSSVYSNLIPSTYISLVFLFTFQMVDNNYAAHLAMMYGPNVAAMSAHPGYIQYGAYPIPHPHPGAFFFPPTHQPQTQQQTMPAYVQQTPAAVVSSQPTTGEDNLPVTSKNSLGPLLSRIDSGSYTSCIV
jgi:hypothetical protein